MGYFGGLLAILIYFVLYNKMMIYVEHRAYGKKEYNKKDLK